jgi:hypothetical protein
MSLGPYFPVDKLLVNNYLVSVKRNFVRTTIVLWAEQAWALQRLARQRRVSLCEVIRCAVDDYLKPAPPPESPGEEAAAGNVFTQAKAQG